jgi:hypothetical protein
LTINLMPQGSRQRAKPDEADMKTLAILLMSAVPAMASVPQDAVENDMQLAPQAVAMKKDPAANATCGKPQEMIIVVRDENGSVVAIGKAMVAPAC